MVKINFLHKPMATNKTSKTNKLNIESTKKLIDLKHSQCYQSEFEMAEGNPGKQKKV